MNVVGLCRCECVGVGVSVCVYVMCVCECVYASVSCCYAKRCEGGFAGADWAVTLAGAHLIPHRCCGCRCEGSRCIWRGVRCGYSIQHLYIVSG